MSHLTEERLLEAFYGDAEISEKRHLDHCPECRARFDDLKGLLETLRDYPVPVQKEGYEQEVWDRIAPGLTAGRRTVLRFWVLAPALAALLAVAFLAGIYTEHRRTSIADKTRERVLLIAMGDHLERSQIVLTELVHTSPGAMDLTSERERARSLLEENRLLRQSALYQGDQTHAALLEDIERVLLPLANSSQESSADEIRMLQERVERESLLWKVRITSSNTREKGLKL